MIARISFKFFSGSKFQFGFVLHSTGGVVGGKGVRGSRSTERAGERERESWTALLCKVKTKMEVDQFIDYNSVSNGILLYKSITDGKIKSKSVQNNNKAPSKQTKKGTQCSC